jgi:hypothetical protein
MEWKETPPVQMWHSAFFDYNRYPTFNVHPDDRTVLNVCWGGPNKWVFQAIFFIEKYPMAKTIGLAWQPGFQSVAAAIEAGNKWWTSPKGERSVRRLCKYYNQEQSSGRQANGIK